jgi:hypothetical protein
MDVRHQLCELARRVVVAIEKDDAADKRVRQQLAILGAQALTGDAEHDGP